MLKKISFICLLLFVLITKVVSKLNNTGTINTFNNTKLTNKETIRKCCPFGLAWYSGSIIKPTKCVTETTEFNPKLYREPENDIFIEGSNVNVSFNVVNEETCNIGESSFVPESIKLLVNGKLFVENGQKQQIYGPDKYCIDNFVFIDSVTNESSVELNALICYTQQPDNNNYALSSTCMLISCFFIILTVAVYAWLPELRNLHGMVLMAYLLSFFVGFLFLATMQILLLWEEINRDMCTGFTFVIYFALLAAFFWLNIMCYDIWWTFSGTRCVSNHPTSPIHRFMAYSLYAFGMPMILTILMSILEFTVPADYSRYLPRIRDQVCFLHGTSKFIYLYVPMIILCVANLIFFTLTAIKIIKIKKQTQVLNQKDKQRFTLYIKLFIVMGINWILEVISSFYPDANYVWQFTDAYNVLVGLVIFLIFVCKGKTWRRLKDRYRHMMSLQPMSRTQTTSTSISTRTYSQSTEKIQINLAKQ